MSISAEMFHRWKADPVTIELMTYLEEIRDDLKEGLQNPTIIMGNNTEKTLAHMLGHIEALDLVLNLRTENIVENDNEDTAPSRA